jgi:hypothetical protein
MLIVILIFDVYYKFCESITAISYTKHYVVIAMVNRDQDVIGMNIGMKRA